MRHEVQRSCALIQFVLACINNITFQRKAAYMTCYAPDRCREFLINISSHFNFKSLASITLFSVFYFILIRNTTVSSADCYL